MDVKGIGCERLEVIYVTQNSLTGLLRAQFVQKEGKFLTSSATISFSRRNQLCGVTLQFLQANVSILP
jgi:hypothetical protein